MVMLDVKPWDDETNMEEIETHVRSIVVEGLVWGNCALRAPTRALALGRTNAMFKLSLCARLGRALSFVCAGLCFTLSLAVHSPLCALASACAHCRSALASVCAGLCFALVASVHSL